MLDADRISDFAPLREALRRSGYTKAGLVERLRVFRLRSARYDYALMSALISGDSDLDALIRLFALGEEIPEARASELLAPADAAELAAAGLLRRGRGALSSAAALVPIEEWYLLSDWSPEVTGRPCPEGYVLGAGAAPLNLAGLAVRKPAADALDLGTGGGVQSLFLSAFAERVLATDVNRRALSFAAFNMRMNGISNVDLRQGSLYEPAGDGTFDLIVSNPPFVISPDKSSEFRSATDRESDSLSEAVVRGAGPRLRPGGFAVALVNWPHGEADSWAEAPLSWAESPGVSRWVMCFDTEEPPAYAARWIRDSGERLEGADLSQRLGEWLAYYRRRGIRWISAGAVILHRAPGGTAWTRADRLQRDVEKQGLCGGQIERICEAENLLSMASDEDLLGMEFRPAPEAALVQEMKLEGGGWKAESSTLAMRGGFGLAGSADAGLMGILARLNGGADLRASIGDLARSLSSRPEDFAGPVLEAVKKLLRTGLLSRVFPRRT